MKCFSNKIKWIVPLGLTFVFVFHSVAILKQFKDTYKKHKRWRINRLQPRFSYLASFIQGEDFRNEYLLREAVIYYKTIIRYYPDHADGYFMLGFCYHKLNKKGEAEAFYRKAIALNERNFWPHYNLGILAFEQGRFEEASRTLMLALDVPLDGSLQIVHQSRTFQQIKSFLPNDYMLNQNLRTGVTNSYFLLALIYYYTHDYKKMFLVSKLAQKTSIEPKHRFKNLQNVARLKLNKKPVNEIMIQVFEDDLHKNIRIGIF